MDAFEFLPPKGEFVLDIKRFLTIVCQLICPMLMKPQLLWPNSEPEVPLHTQVFPFLKNVLVISRLHKKLHFSLFKLACAKNEVSGRNLIPKCLPDLRDTEGDFLSRRTLNVQEIHENSLSRLRSQIHSGG